MDTSNIDIQQKAHVLVEALPYIQRFRGSIFVVKFGGSLLDDKNALANVALDAVFLSSVGIKVVLVHGGGKAISRAMTEAGLVPEFKNGQRVTDGKTIDIVAHVLDDETNLSICETIQSRFGRPLGIAGRKVIVAEKMLMEIGGVKTDMGYLGRPKSINVYPIKHALETGYTPVISPVGADENGQLYNINADIAAANIASALCARRLVYLCDVPGLMKDPKRPETLISTLYLDEVHRFRESGVISSGMAPKVDSACDALASGVRRVHFIDGRVAHSVLLEIFTDKGIGTEIMNR
jgi:acetylglutamate kinase